MRRQVTWPSVLRHTQRRQALVGAQPFYFSTGASSLSVGFYDLGRRHNVSLTASSSSTLSFSSASPSVVFSSKRCFQTQQHASPPPLASEATSPSSTPSSSPSSSLVTLNSSPVNATASAAAAAAVAAAAKQQAAVFPFFRLGAVIDGHAFIANTRKAARALQRYDAMMKMQQQKSINNNAAAAAAADKGGAKATPPPIHPSQVEIDLNDPEWIPLTSFITVPFLERELWHKRGLKNDMLSTLLVPYSVAKDIILSMLPDRYKDLATQELDFEESARVKNRTLREEREALLKAMEAGKQHTILLNNDPTGLLRVGGGEGGGSSSSSSAGGVNGGDAKSLQQKSSPAASPTSVPPLRQVPIPINKIIQYKDDDVYGTASIMKGLGPTAAPPSSPSSPPTTKPSPSSASSPSPITAALTAALAIAPSRVPIVCVMGHIDHGKTTLLDTLMASNMCAREAGRITQSVRCFTVAMRTCVAQLEGRKMMLQRERSKQFATAAAEKEVGEGKQERQLQKQDDGGDGNSGQHDAGNGSLITVAADEHDSTSLHRNDADVMATIPPSRYATYPTSITFVDTPGHKAFAEMRYHSQLASDVVVLIIALDEGIKSQTLEVLHVALNMDRPMVVVLNKTDKFSDPRLLAGAIVQTVQSLAKEGLKIKLVSSLEELEVLRKPQTISNKNNTDINSSSGHPFSLTSLKKSAEALALQRAPIAPFLAKRSQIAEVVKASASSSGSLKKKRNSGGGGGGKPSSSSSSSSSSSASVLLMDPVLESGKLQRKAIGVCLSGMNGANVDLLLELLRTAAQLLDPRAEAGPATKVQAQVLEASKTTERTEQRELHGRFSHSREGGGGGGGGSGSSSSQLSASSSDLQKEMASQGTAGGSRMAQRAVDRAMNNYSTNHMIITAIVRSGVLKVGLPFVADQCVGTVRKLLDYWGRPLKLALPGTAVVIIDDRSESGCPGVGTHVIGVASIEKAMQVNALRRHIAWFVEAFPKRTELLRPVGMDHSFQAVGNFGQIDQRKTEKSLEYRLLYGGGPKEREKDSSATSSLAAVGSGDTTATAGGASEGGSEPSGAEEGNKAAEAVAPSSVVEGTPAEVEARWSSLQMEKIPETKEEMEEVQKNGKLIGVYCKVDSWHSARILQREIPRLSTKHIFFSVIGIKFGQLKSDDTQDFINNARCVICYRTPRLQCPKTFRHLELFKFHFLETDIYSDVVTYLKMVAIEEHEKFIKERGSLEGKRQHEVTKSLLDDIGIRSTYGRRRGVQAITRLPGEGFD